MKKLIGWSIIVSTFLGLLTFLAYIVHKTTPNSIFLEVYLTFLIGGIILTILIIVVLLLLQFADNLINDY